MEECNFLVFSSGWLSISTAPQSLYMWLFDFSVWPLIICSVFDFWLALSTFSLFNFGCHSPLLLLHIGLTHTFLPTSLCSTLFRLASTTFVLALYSLAASLRSTLIADAQRVLWSCLSLLSSGDSETGTLGLIAPSSSSIALCSLLDPHALHVTCKSFLCGL